MRAMSLSLLLHGFVPWACVTGMAGSEASPCQGAMSRHVVYLTASQLPFRRSTRKLRGRATGAAAQERSAVVDQLLELLSSPLVDLNRALSYYQKEIDEIESAENRAAMMAPNGEKADHLQRMEDASLRQLWRLTNLWMKVRNGEMHPKNKKSYKCSG